MLASVATVSRRVHSWMPLTYLSLLTGKYPYVLEAVNQRDFLVLFTVTAGAGVGIAAFSRVLSWLLLRYHDLMAAFLTGLILGALRKVWPWKETLQSMTDGHGNPIPLVQVNVLPAYLDGEVLPAAGLMAAGFLIVFYLDKPAQPPSDTGARRGG